MDRFRDDDVVGRNFLTIAFSFNLVVPTPSFAWRGSRGGHSQIFSIETETLKSKPDIDVKKVIQRGCNKQRSVGNELDRYEK